LVVASRGVFIDEIIERLELLAQSFSNTGESQLRGRVSACQSVMMVVKGKLIK
jgi:hypothetical protein